MIAAQGHSLSRRLLIGLILVTFAYWSGVAWLTVRDSVDEVYELFDAHLAQTALALLRVTDQDEDDPAVIPNKVSAPTLQEVFNPGAELPERQPNDRASATPMLAGSTHALHADYEKNLRYQVWNGTGSLLLRSAHAPAQAMTALDGYSQTTDAQGRLWRHYGVWDSHRNFRILVSEAHELRNRLVRNIALHVVSPLAFGLPVLILLFWFSIKRGLDPLDVLTHEIEARKPDNLMRLDAAYAPREVRPMVLALNDLLQRMSHSLEGERRFTANAAHELRTPLAAIKAQLYAARVAASEDERQFALTHLQSGVERAIRLVSQLLVLARLDPEQALPDARATQLGDVAEAVCAELAPLALQRDQTLELHVEPDLPPLPGNADLLAMLLCNLVDNAVRYTQRGGHICIDVKRCPTGLQMQVCDNGPGIAPAQRERVFDRFYRIAAQDQPGTGLGLAICKRIAELHRTRITLAEGPNGQGVKANIDLPLT